MKIVHVCSYYPPHIGGTEGVAKNLAVQLAQNGHDVTVLTSNVGAGKPGTAHSQNLREVFLRGFEFAHTPFIPALPWRLFRLSKDSLVHIHLSHVYTEMMVMMVMKLRGMPYVGHFHMDVDVSGPLGFVFKAYKKTLLPFVIRGAAKVITLSDEQRELVIDRYHAKSENVTVIPNGVADAYFIDRAKRPANKTPKILFVGRFALQKNLPRLLNALPLMKREAELHLVGDGEKRPEVEALIKQLDLKNVRLHGRKGGDELVDLYRQADVFAIPSDREGMPLTLLEAMATGLPVVASDVQGLREFIGTNGVLVRDPSPQTFAAALDSLLSDPAELQRLQRVSRAWAEDYAWSSLTKRVEAVYQEVEHASH
jgi:glycosyltransferase involved in cell wall biosynthesis